MPSTSERSLDDCQGHPVMCWSISDVSQWLTQLGLAQYIEVFRDNAIDGTELFALTDDTLERSLKVGEYSSYG